MASVRTAHGQACRVAGLLSRNTGRDDLGAVTVLPWGPSLHRAPHQPFPSIAEASVRGAGLQLGTLQYKTECLSNPSLGETCHRQLARTVSEQNAS